MIVDTNVLIDLLDGQGGFAEAAASAMADLVGSVRLTVNEIIFAEFAGRFTDTDATKAFLTGIRVEVVSLSLDDCQRAGNAFHDYRRRGAPRTTILPDFLIGAQAQGRQWPILTRDRKRFATNFADVTLIDPMKVSP